MELTIVEWLNLLLPLRRKVPPLILLSSSWTVWPSTADLRLSSLNSDTGWTCPTFKHYTCSGFKTNYLIESKKKFIERVVSLKVIKGNYVTFIYLDKFFPRDIYFLDGQVTINLNPYSWEYTSLGGLIPPQKQWSSLK